MRRSKTWWRMRSEDAKGLKRVGEEDGCASRGGAVAESGKSLRDAAVEGTPRKNESAHLYRPMRLQQGPRE